MHTKTALAVAGTVLAVPSAALAATADDIHFHRPTTRCIRPAS